MRKSIICFITILFLFANVARAQESDGPLENEAVLVLIFGALTGTIIYKEVWGKDEGEDGGGESQPEEKTSFLDMPPDDATIKPYLNMYNDGGDNKVETGIKLKF